MKIVQFEDFQKFHFTQIFSKKSAFFFSRFFHGFLSSNFEFSAGYLVILDTYFTLYSLVRAFFQKILEKGCPWGHYRVLHGTRLFWSKSLSNQGYTLKVLTLPLINKIKSTLNWSQGQEKNETLPKSWFLNLYPAIFTTSWAKTLTWF